MCFTAHLRPPRTVRWDEPRAVLRGPSAGNGPFPASACLPAHRRPLPGPPHSQPWGLARDPGEGRRGGSHLERNQCSDKRGNCPEMIEMAKGGKPGRLSGVKEGWGRAGGPAVPCAADPGLVAGPGRASLGQRAGQAGAGPLERWRVFQELRGGRSRRMPPGCSPREPACCDGRHPRGHEGPTSCRPGPLPAFHTAPRGVCGALPCLSCKQARKQRFDPPAPVPAARLPGPCRPERQGRVFRGPCLRLLGTS